MPTEQPDGNIRDLKDFKDIQRACCKSYASQPGGPQGAGGFSTGMMTCHYITLHHPGRGIINFVLPYISWARN